MLLSAITKAFKQDQLEKSAIQGGLNDMVFISGNGGDESYTAIELFRKMHIHCNFMAEMELSDINDVKNFARLSRTSHTYLPSQHRKMTR